MGRFRNLPFVVISEEELKREEKEIRENLEKLEEVIENKKRLPEEEKNSMIKRIKTNTIIFIIILAYLVVLGIGQINIQTEYYIATLRVLSVLLVLATIIMLEIAYRRNENNIIVHSIEILVLTFFTLFLISAYSLYFGNFYIVIIIGAIVSLLYYTIKCFIIWRKTKKQYYKSLNDIPTIVENKLPWIAIFKIIVAKCTQRGYNIFYIWFRSDLKWW